jgi:hypothetical protein
MPGMLETCETCERLREGVEAATIYHARKESERKGFVPNVPISSEDAKRIEELRIAEENAQTRLDEANKRFDEHRRTAGH